MTPATTNHVLFLLRIRQVELFRQRKFWEVTTGTTPAGEAQRLDAETAVNDAAIEEVQKLENAR